MSQPAELHETKSDLAYRLVRDQILSGGLGPGSVIQQRELAKLIGISTTPLREAMRRLKSEGLVELDAHRDARVADLRAEEARDLLEIRRSLDPLAAALAAERRTRADIAAIRAAHHGLEPLPSHPSVDELVAHRRFHAAIYTASHNELLIETLENLWDKADRYRRLALETGRGQAARDIKAKEHAPARRVRHGRRQRQCRPRDA
jgi:DNA-binding GntR family transcriptional regulator